MTDQTAEVENRQARRWVAKRCPDPVNGQLCQVCGARYVCRRGDSKIPDVRKKHD